MISSDKSRASGRGIGLSPIQAEQFREMLTLRLPVAYMASVLGVSAKVLSWRIPPDVARYRRNPNSPERRASRVSRIKAHIEAMPGIPMTIASEAVECVCLSKRK